MAKVLVIDDELSIRSLLGTVLRQKGYDVVLAENGRKGLESFHQERPDVIVLDLIMPEPDGMAVLHQIRRVDLSQPVIILTGALTLESERQFHTQGATQFVEKAASLDRLEEALERALKTLQK